MTDAAPPTEPPTEPPRKLEPSIGINASLKRIAWAYGCAKKGSAEEKRLRALLLEKVDDERTRGTASARCSGACGNYGRVPYGETFMCGGCRERLNWPNV